MRQRPCRLIVTKPGVPFSLADEAADHWTRPDMRKTVTSLSVLTLLLSVGVAHPDAAEQPQASEPLVGCAALLGRRMTGGVKAGVNVASLRNEEAESDSVLGLVAGGFLGYRLSCMVGLQVEGLYSQKGVTLAPGVRTFGSRTTRLDYFEVPILATFTWRGGTGTRPLLLTGPAIGVNITARRAGLSEARRRVLNQFVRGWELGWVLGGGIELGSVTLEARYTLGLTSVFDVDLDDSDADDRNQVLAFLVGYRF